MNKFQKRSSMISKHKEQEQSQEREHDYATAKKQVKKRQRDTSATRKRMYGRQAEEARPAARNNRKLTKAQIKQLYQNLMNQSQYTEAEKVHATIHYLNTKQKQKRVRRLSQEHSIQKDAIKASHEHEMKFFREAWRELFMEQAMKERMMMQRLDRMRKLDEDECKERITRRCQSAKPVAGIARLYEIDEVQRALRKRGKTIELRRVREDKKKLIVKCRKQQQQNLIKIAQEEKKRMTQKQTRRYRSFMHRIEQDRRDSDRLYRRQQQKLKQKYKNILRNLQHEQSKDLYQLEKSISLCQ